MVGILNDLSHLACIPWSLKTAEVRCALPDIWRGEEVEGLVHWPSDLAFCLGDRDENTWKEGPG